jgi:hypothetical protein
MVFAMGLAAMPGCNSAQLAEEEGSSHAAQKKKQAGDDDPISGGDRTLTVSPTDVQETKVVVCSDKDADGYAAVADFRDHPEAYVHTTDNNVNKWPVVIRHPKGDYTVYAIELPLSYGSSDCLTIPIDPSDEYKQREKDFVNEVENCVGLIPVIGTAVGVIQLIDSLTDKDHDGLGLNATSTVLAALEAAGYGGKIVPLAGQLLSLYQCVDSFPELKPVMGKIKDSLAELANSESGTGQPSQPGNEQPLPEAPKTGDDCADGRIGPDDKICGRSEGTQNILYGCSNGQWFEREECASGCAPTDGVHDYCFTQSADQ